MDEVKKSIKSILYERTTSPLYGTFIISWLIWNWKIIYVTLFVSENSIQLDKLSYLLKNHFIDKYNLILLPILSTIVLLTVFPFISNGAYWLKLNFDKWKKEKKNEVELRQLITIEQSIELREQIVNQEERFEKILTDKNLRIKQLEQILEAKETIQEINNLAEPENSVGENLELKELKEKIMSDPSLKSTYDRLVSFVQAGWRVALDQIPASFLALMESNDVIKPKAGGVYLWGNNGKLFHKMMSK